MRFDLIYSLSELIYTKIVDRSFGQISFLRLVRRWHDIGMNNVSESEIFGFSSQSTITSITCVLSVSFIT